MTDYDGGFPEINTSVPIQLQGLPWTPGTWYGVGARVFNPWTQRYYRAMNAGMSAYGSSGDYLPWPSMEGCTVVDGTIVWVSEGFPYPTGNRVLNPTHVLIPEWVPEPVPEPEVKLEPLFEEREI